VSQATIIMISFLLKNSSDGLDTVVIRMIIVIINKVLPVYLITAYKFSKEFWDRIDTRRQAVSRAAIIMNRTVIWFVRRERSFISYADFFIGNFIEEE